MSSTGPEPPPARDAAQSEALLAQCWEILADVFLPQVPAIFQEALALAVRSGDEAQARAGTALSLHEKALVRAYAAELRIGVGSAVAVFFGHRAAPATAGSVLSLMDMEESDLRSQIDQVAARLRNRVGAAQSALSLRLQALRPGAGAADQVSPLRAAIFLEAVVDAVETVAPGTPDLGLVLRHFPAVMAPHLETCYEALGRFLESQGIEPASVAQVAATARSGMPAPARAAPSAALPTAGPAGSAAQPAPGSTPAPDAAHAPDEADRPAAPARAAAVRAAAPAMASVRPPVAAPAGAAELGADERLLAEYGRVQAQLGINAAPLIEAALESARRPALAPGVVLAPAAPDLLAAMLSAQRQDAGRVAGMAPSAAGAAEAPGAGPGSEALPGRAAGPEFIGSREYSKRLVRLGGTPLQRLTLQIVARIFTRIERDRLVPAEVRTLIVCLRFPFLEVALADPGVLARAEHPARRLIHAIATSSIGWVPDGAENQRYLRHARSAVHFVVHSPGSAASAFEQSCDQFEAFLAAVLPSTGTMLVAARDALRDAEKRQFQAAEAAAFMAQLIEGSGLDDYLCAFICGPWAQVLAEGAAAEPREPGLFRKLLMVIPDLIASVRPPASAAERKRLVDTVAPLLQSLREGVARVAWPAEKMEAFLGRLMVAHAQMLSGGEPAAAAGAFSASTVRIRLDGFALREPPEIDPENPVPIAEEAVQAALARYPSNVVHQWFTTPPAVPADAIDIDTARGQLRHWRDRMWFDIRLGRTLVRMRLVLWTPGRTLALFTSRSGSSLASFSHETLLGYLRCRLAAPAESAPLLTRALRSVLKDLRRSAQAAAETHGNGA